MSWLMDTLCPCSVRPTCSGLKLVKDKNFWWNFTNPDRGRAKESYTVKRRYRNDRLLLKLWKHKAFDVDDHDALVNGLNFSLLLPLLLMIPYPTQSSIQAKRICPQPLFWKLQSAKLWRARESN